MNNYKKTRIILSRKNHLDKSLKTIINYYFETKPLKIWETPDSNFALVRGRQRCLSYCESNRLHVVLHAGDNTTRPYEPDNNSPLSSSEVISGFT